MTKNDWIDIILFDLSKNRQTYVHNKEDYRNYLLARDECLIKHIIEPHVKVYAWYQLGKLGYEIIESNLKYEDWLKTRQLQDFSRYRSQMPKIKTNRLDRKFVKFLFDRETALASEIDIEEFMVANFKKPDPLSENTINATDKGVIFLKNLKRKMLIGYDDVALSHVNKWTIDTDGKIKRWFDTLHEPLYVTLQIPLSEFLPLSSRLLNRKFVLKQIKSAIKNGMIYGLKFIIGAWKFLLLVAATFIGGWLSLDHNFMNVIHWIKNNWFK
ncbi:MAG: hypothetical protein NVSMB24_07940 [Mucilaginibacter sp.]